MYHFYVDGYSVLPGLFPLNHSFGNKLDNKFFQIDDNLKLYQSVKYNAIDSQTCTACAYGQDYTKLDHQFMTDFVKTKILEEYPEILNLPNNMDALALRVQEDIVVFQAKTDRICYFHICMPSGWDPLEKLNKTFKEIHQDIPGMHLDKSEGLKRAMLNNGPFQRFVWSVIFENRLNGHPSIPKRQFDINDPVIYVKVERQVIKGFPEKGLVLFLIRQHLIPFEEIKLPELLKSLQAMTQEELVYKGLDRSINDLISFLESKIKGDA